MGRALCATWIAALAALVFLVLPNVALAQTGRWLRAESRHFIAYSDHSEARTREALEELEGFDELLRILARTGPETAEPVKLEVYLFRSSSSLRDVGPGLSSSVAGFYSAQPEIIAAFAIFRDRGLEAEEVLFHEYAHHFLLQNFTVAYPKWYVEGFSEYVQTAEIAPERVTWGRYSEGRVAYSIAPAIWPPMERMLRGNYRESEIGPFYALSWLMTHYFNHQPERRAGLLAYFEKLRQGGDPVTEFPNAIGVSIQEFQRELREYLRGRITYHVMTRAPRSASAISVSRLPEAADDLLTLTARIRFGRSEADRPGLLDRVRRIAERHPNEEYAQRELARAEIALGSPVAGRARLEPLLSRNGENAEALYLTGLSYVMEGRADEARRADLYRQGRRFFSRVYRINPDHVPTLYRYVETYSAEPGPLTAQQLDVLVHARNLAPQVAEIGLNTGAQLMAAQRLEEATAVLRQIAYNPHGGDASKRALEMLAEAERRAGEGSESSQPAGD